MAIDTKTSKNIHGWDMKLWLWVFLCSAAIFSTIPLARGIQVLTYDTVGREFFTYSVLFAVTVVLLILLYSLFFKSRVKNVSQYIWLFSGGSLYICFTLMLRQNPEESVHLIEYGLLAFFVFKALNYRIRDWTVYLSSALTVLFIGTVDEFIQWMMPGRYWDYRDIGINAAAAAFFLLTVSKGVKPDSVCGPPGKFSVRMMAGLITLNLIFLGLCLSNTPDAVNAYTSELDGLLWLRNEEAMSDYGYKHKDEKIGTFHSRFTLEELKKIDLKNGESYGNLLTRKASSEGDAPELLKIYTPYNNPFLYEFLTHVARINNNLERLTETDDPDKQIEYGNIAYREHMIIGKFFKTTLQHSGPGRHEKIFPGLQNTAPLTDENYISKTGKIITHFSIKTAWLFIITTLVIVWIYDASWERRLNGG